MSKDDRSAQARPAGVFRLSEWLGRWPRSEEMMASQEVRWCVEERDTGMPCASGSAPTEEAASREMMRYALQYGQDGPVRYWMRQNRKTIVKGEIAGVSVTMKRTDGGDLRTLLAGH